MKPPANVVMPPGVLTRISCAPTVPAGVSAVMVVELTITTLVASAPPTVTLVAPNKFVPVIVIGVAPRFEPKFGETLARVGDGRI